MAVNSIRSNVLACPAVVMRAEMTNDAKCALQSQLQLQTKKFAVRCSMASEIPQNTRNDFNSTSRLVIESKPLSVVQKAKEDIFALCSNAKGACASDYWEAYWQFLSLEEECKEEPEGSPDKLMLENLVRRSATTKDLIAKLLAISKFRDNCRYDLNPGRVKEGRKIMDEGNPASERGKKEFPVPDELPKTAEELEQERSQMLVETPHSRLLRVVGRNIHPPWYTPRPDHETD